MADSQLILELLFLQRRGGCSLTVLLLKRTFCFNHVRDFNMLPSQVKNTSSYGQFRLKLNIELGY